MEENKNLEMENVQNQEEKSAIDFQLIYTTLILNWKWFILSIILCLGLGYLYLQHAKPVFQTTTKVLIKDDDQSKRGGRFRQGHHRCGCLPDSYIHRHLSF